MQKVIIARMGKPSRQWQVWSKGLGDAGFKVHWLGLLAMELQKFHVRRGDVVLCDGLLPNLPEIIQRIHSHCKDVCIIVVAEVETPKVKHDATQFNGVPCIAGPMPAEHFVEAIKNAIARELAA